MSEENYLGGYIPLSESNLITRYADTFVRDFSQAIELAYADHTRVDHGARGRPHIHKMGAFALGMPRKLRAVYENYRKWKDVFDEVKGRYVGIAPESLEQEPKDDSLDTKSLPDNDNIDPQILSAIHLDPAVKAVIDSIGCQEIEEWPSSTNGKFFFHPEDGMARFMSLDCLPITDLGKDEDCGYRGWANIDKTQLQEKIEKGELPFFQQFVNNGLITEEERQ